MCIYIYILKLYKHNKQLWWQSHTMTKHSKLNQFRTFVIRTVTSSIYCITVGYYFSLHHDTIECLLWWSSQLGWRSRTFVSEGAQLWVQIARLRLRGCGGVLHVAAARASCGGVHLVAVARRESLWRASSCGWRHVSNCSGSLRHVFRNWSDSLNLAWA